MDPEKIRKIWQAVKAIIDILIGFFLGTQASTWLGGPLLLANQFNP